MTDHFEQTVLSLYLLVIYYTTSTNFFVDLRPVKVTALANQVLSLK